MHSRARIERKKVGQTPHIAAISFVEWLNDRETEVGVGWISAPMAPRCPDVYTLCLCLVEMVKFHEHREGGHIRDTQRQRATGNLGCAMSMHRCGSGMLQHPYKDIPP